MVECHAHLAQPQVLDQATQSCVLSQAAQSLVRHLVHARVLALLDGLEAERVEGGHVMDRLGRGVLRPGAAPLVDIAM